MSSSSRSAVIVPTVRAGYWRRAEQPLSWQGMRSAGEVGLMQFGVQLHPELGADSVIREAQRADALGYDSVWLYDHLMNWAGVQTADFPLETLTLAAAIGAATTRVRISWAVLNLGFYNPAVLAKSLATTDQITHGRVICTAG